MGKMDFVHTVVGQIKRNAAHGPVDAAVAKASALVPAMAVPFEKRVLLDAVLEWDLDGLTQTTTLLSGIHHLLKTQFDAYESFLDSFETLADGALTTMNVLGELNDINGNDNADQLQEMIERMTSAIAQLKAGSLSALSALFTDANETPIDFDGEIEVLVEDALILAADPSDAFTPEQKAEVRNAVAKSGIAATFNLTAFTTNTITEKVDTLAETLATALPGFALDKAAIGAEITKVADSYFGGILNGALKLDLTDVEITDASNNTLKLIDFEQTAEADFSSVTVTINLPSLNFDLDGLLDLAFDGQGFPFTMNTAAVAQSMSFVISTVVKKQGAVVEAIGVDITEFDFAPLFQIGGLVDVTGIDKEINLGLLTAAVSSVSTAKIRATAEANPDLNFGGQLNFTGATLLESFYDADLEDKITIKLEIDQVELGDEADVGFIEVEENERYNLLAVGLGGALNFFESAAGNAASAYTYAATVSLSSIINNGDSTTAAQTVSNFINDAQIGFDVDLSGSVTDETLRDALEKSIEALVGMGIDEITGFLRSVGDLIADVLDAVTSDITIPFTNFEISSVVEAINSAFAGLADAFTVNTVQLGYAANAPTAQTLSPEVAQQTSPVLDFDALTETLAGYDSITFTVLDRNLATNAVTTEDIILDLTTIAGWADETATAADRFTALINAMNLALAAKGFTATLVDGAVKIALNLAAHANRTLAIKGALPSGSSSSTLDQTINLATLGFKFGADGQTGQLTNAVLVPAQKITVAGAEVEVPAQTIVALSYFQAVGSSFIPGAEFDKAMIGVSALRYFAVVDGETIDVIVKKPAAGWYDEATGKAKLPDMVAAFNAALQDAGVAITASQNAANTGIDFALTADATGQIEFGVDPEKLTRAFDLETLIEWVNETLRDVELLDGSQLKLTQDGKLMFIFPSIENSVTVGTNGNVGFDSSSLGAVGQLADLSLKARLTAALNARFDASVGIDLVGFVSGLIGDSADGKAAKSVLDAKAEQQKTNDLLKTDAEPIREEWRTAFSAVKEAQKQLDIAIKDEKPEADINALKSQLAAAETTLKSKQTGLDAANKAASESSILHLVLENVFFSNLALAVDVLGTATNVTGSADLGLIAAAVGRNDASKNFITLNAQMDLSLIGQRGGDDFGSEVSLRNLIDAVTYKNAAGEFDSLRGLNGLIGRTDFVGGIVTNGAGLALDSAGEAVTSAAAVRNEMADTYSLQTGERLSMLHIYLGDISVDTFGVSGINEDFINGVSVTIDNLAKPMDTLNYKLLGNGADSVEALANLGQGDILDSFATIANMLSVLGNSLKTKLPFLDTDIPLLNFSLLDAVDFSSDFAKALQDLRKDPSAGLNKADQFLEKYFGQDTVTLAWNSTAKTLTFDLKLEFLKDYSKEISFNFDLAAILGEALGDALGDAGPIAAKLITGFVDVGGDGKLVFDPDLALNLSFGIDLSKTLVDLTQLAVPTTPLSDLTTVRTLNQSDIGKDDFTIRWRDMTSGTNKVVRFDMDGAETLDDMISGIHEALREEFGPTVSFEYDAATGKISLTDSNADKTDVTDVNALFGTTLQGRSFERSAGASDPVADEPATPQDESAAYIPQVLKLREDFAAFANAAKFTIAFGPESDAQFAETITLELAADAARDTAEEFAAAINTALAALDVPRTAVNPNSVGGWTVAASHLIKASVVDDVITLTSTNFTDAIGAPPFAFGVGGVDISHNVTFTLTELNGSNLLRAIGFTDLGKPLQGNVTSDTLYIGADIGAPRVYLDTAKSGIEVTMIAGAPDGLNLKLGLGPLSVNVVNGSAQITAGMGLTDPAFMKIGFVDVDGDAFLGQYDLSDLFDIAFDGTRSFADLLSLDIGLGINVDLSFRDSLGIFKPAEHGLTYTTNIITTNGPVAFSDIDLDNLSNTFKGDLVNIFEEKPLEGTFDLDLPNLTDILADFNILALLNDPRAVLDGLDLILDQLQTLFDDYLSGIKLPIVGDTISSAVTFFNDFRYNVIEKARVIAETPKENGELPTTIDLITGWFNDQLNNLFNPGKPKIQFIHMYLNTDGGLTDSYLYGAINFSAEIFREKLDIALDLGIPGFEIEVNQGSEVELALGYSVNIGFGLDKKGFFLLNDITAKEIGIEFIADAGSLQGSAKLLGLLGVTADAVTISKDANGKNIVNGVGAAKGTLQMTASLGVDLFGTDGVDINTIKIGEGEDAKDMDLSGIDLRGALNDPLTGEKVKLEFEKLVYLSKLNSSQLVKFTFNADVDIQIGLKANVIDPTNGQPLKISGKEVIPSVLTEIVFQGGFNSDEADLGFQISRLEFVDVRMDMAVLYDAIIKPVLDPIRAFIDPILPLISWMQKDPFSFLVDALGKAFPIFGMAAGIAKIISDVAAFDDMLKASGGMYVFGSFDFTASVADGGQVGSAPAEMNTAGATQAVGAPGNKFGVFGNTSSGFWIELPLLTDPMSALNILTGKFDQVDLLEVTFTLMNVNFPRTNIVDMVLDSFSAPGWVKRAISKAFKATIEARLIAEITAGYDMGGIVNFINTLDPVRLLDGVYLDSSKHLLDVYFGLTFGLNLGIAGINGGAYGGVTLDFNDPNNDGKLRIPELLYIIDNSTTANFLGNLFKGTIEAGADLSLWAGIRLPWPLPDLVFDVTIFDLDFKETFGGNTIGAQISTKVNAGETAILNIGARAGGNMTSIDKDGDDRVVINGPNSPIQVTLNTNQGTTSGSFSENAGGLIIPAGEGNNTIDMSGLTFGKPTVTYTGAGRDTIILPNSGLNVVFAGDGVDTITQTGASTGTYVIFGGGGADNINIQNGNVIYFGDSEFGMRDRFMTAFANGGLTEAAMLSMLGLNADGTVGSGGTYTNPSGGTLTLNALLENYTALTQISAANTVETVTLGAGNHVILTGRAADQITTTGTTGQVRVYSGDGADVLRLGGATLYVEAGAGSDRIFTSAGQSEVWGWGKQAGIDGSLGTAGSTAIDALAQRDGADLMIGGAGHDKFYGQIGRDIIEGNGGDDTIVGGMGVDLITGGTFNITTAAGAAVTLANVNPATGFGTGIRVFVENAADGHDSILGGLGADILLGGGGNDTIDGGAGADVVIGDFAIIGLSANLVAETIETNFDTSGHAGTDVLTGGSGNDVLIAGGSVPGTSESVTDTEGSNVILGDFGRVAGARLSEAVTLVESFASPMGGADSITTGRGNDMIIGGEGNDTINAGRGGDIVIADLGRIDITANTVQSIANPNAGNDSIAFDGTGQDVTDILIAGLGDDTITAGRGGLLLLGDDGTITLDSAALSALRSYTPIGNITDEAALAQAQADDLAVREKIAKLAVSLVSANTAHDGHDSVTITGAGYLRAVMGGGNDVVSLGTEDSYVLADDGTITTLTAGVDMVAAVALRAGDDTITSLGGADMIIGGAGNDRIVLGNGNDIVLGDMGQMRRETVAGVTTVTVTADTTIAGNDTVLGDAGAKTVLLGQGDDVATLGNTGSLVLGDTGAATMVGGTWVAQTDQSIGGNDSITTGSGADIILGGIGDDTIHAGAGNNIILGDTGSYNNSVLTSASDAADGNDYVTALGGLDRVILGGGNDVADLGTGDNRVIGDSGVNNWADAATELLEVSDILIGGHDSITTGAGHDIILGAAGNDTISAGAGDNLILGDAGSWTPSVLTSRSNTADGDDSVTALGGLDRVILGGGNDVADLGTGDNRVIGDSGSISYASGELVEVTDNAVGGNDTITTTGGADIIIGAVGSDVIDAGNGNNLILGDTGRIEIDPTGRAFMIGEDTLNGAADTITSGTGRDAIIAGLGGDLVTSGAGDDAILGDLGRFSESQAALDGVLQSLTAFLLLGNDTISSGAGNDMVIAGLGDDQVNAGTGEDLVMGDNAYVTFAGTAAIMSFNAENIEFGGNDSIQTTGTGDDIIMGQSGADTINAAGGDDLIIADLALVTLSDARAALAGQSAADRFTRMEGVRPDLGFNDVVTGGQGADIIMGGFGADLIRGQGGQDFIIGDSVTILRRWAMIGTMIEETIDLESNFAFLTGGADTLNGGVGQDIENGSGGADVLIGGLGPDLFVGNTAANLIHSDSYAGIFKAYLPNGFASSPFPHRALFTSNFAGPGAIDVVSEAQQNAAIGNVLNNLVTAPTQTSGENARNISEQAEQAALSEQQLEAIFDLLASQEVLQAVAALLAAGASDALISEALQNYLYSSGVLSQNINPLQLELILNTIVSQLTKTALGDADNQPNNELPLAAE